LELFVGRMSLKRHRGDRIPNPSKKPEPIRYVHAHDHSNEYLIVGGVILIVLGIFIWVLDLAKVFQLGTTWISGSGYQTSNVIATVLIPIGVLLCILGWSR
jgi:hypothetical protein